MLTQTTVALAATLPQIQPELCLGAGVGVVLLGELLLPARERKAVGWTAVAFSLMALILAVRTPAAGPGVSAMLFADGASRWLKALAAAAAGVVALLALRSREAERMPAGETYAFLLAGALGCCLMGSARNLLLLYLGMETVSYSSYLLTAFLRDDLRSNEAALKYVLYGAVASGCMLFGISLLYGMAGTLDLAAMGPALAAVTAKSSPLALALPFALVLAGLGFKVSAAPFHQWTPDVYEGAPTPVTAFLSVAPKAAGLMALVRLTALGLSTGADHLPVFGWPAVLGLLAVLTMTAGNLGALGQTNVKRLLAYSSVAHAGYMLMALAGMGSAREGLPAVLFYLAAYLAMNLGAFGVVMALSRVTGSEELSSWKGLGWRHPFLGCCMVAFLMSLTGLPPFGGFVGKFLLFKAALAATSSAPWMYAVVAAGLLNSVIALAYYIRVAKVLFMEKAGAEPKGQAGWLQPLAVGLLAAATLYLGVCWGPLSAAVAAAAGDFGRILP